MRKHLHLLAATVLMMFCVGSTCAADFSLGMAAAVATSPYKSHDNYLGVAPFASYDGGRLYLRPSEAGVYLWNNGGHKVGAAIRYSWLKFDPDDCDDGEMRHLDKRRSTLMAGLSYSYTGTWGILRLGITRDILGRSDGYAGEASYHIPLTQGKLTLLPGAGVSWQSRKHADYYFGVSRGESIRSGIRTHTAKASFAPFVAVEGKFALTSRLSAVASLRGELLTGSVKKSPMVGRSYTVSAAVGIQLAF